mmetsp:Transcript_19438/g.14107  ORF Transcript_19438/g.14107 Transcript_19438/m.14107 type:complete len:91 (+) Transcript_19438:283-555(+)
MKREQHSQRHIRIESSLESRASVDDQGHHNLVSNKSRRLLESKIKEEFKTFLKNAEVDQKGKISAEKCHELLISLGLIPENSPMDSKLAD